MLEPYLKQILHILEVVALHILILEQRLHSPSLH